jgi:hypothetical protein
MTEGNIRRWDSGGYLLKDGTAARRSAATQSIP